MENTTKPHPAKSNRFPKSPIRIIIMPNLRSIQITTFTVITIIKRRISFLQRRGIGLRAADAVGHRLRVLHKHTEQGKRQERGYRNRIQEQ